MGHSRLCKKLVSFYTNCNNHYVWTETVLCGHMVVAVLIKPQMVNYIIS